MDCRRLLFLIDIFLFYWCTKKWGHRQYKTLTGNTLQFKFVFPLGVVRIHDHKKICIRYDERCRAFYDTLRCCLVFSMKTRIHWFKKILTINKTSRSFDVTFWDRHCLSKISNNTKIFSSVLWIKILIYPFFFLFLCSFIREGSIYTLPN